jgi:diguanylate cyclase (GGDEF)-like protein
MWPSLRTWLPSLKPRERRFLASGVLALVASIALVMFTARAVVEDQLRDNAEEEVENWTRFVATAIPEIDEALVAGELSPRVVRRLALLAESDEVRAFRMFDLQGRLLIASTDLPRDLRDGQALKIAPRGEPVALAVAVAADGEERVELHHEDEPSGELPGVHSDAMALLKIDGRPVAVFEVIIDQTERAESAEHAFLAIAAMVALLLSAIGAVGLWQIARGVAERRRVEARMVYLAQHDVLSGALNRASFQEQLDKAAWRREQGGPGFAVLCIDLDHFKHVNDSLGHGAGDEVLRQATERLRGLVRQGDVVARLGGDEFAVLQSGISSPDDVATLAQRVVDELGAPYHIAGQPVGCSASIGAARYGIDATTVEDLLRKADVALYRAKADGRGRFSFYDQTLDEQLSARRDLAHDLRHALADGALDLH